MDDDYYSIESILAENQKIQCTFKVDVPDMGHLDGGKAGDIKALSKVQIPLWMAYILIYSDHADFTIPPPFAARVRNALNAEPRSVRLSALVGQGGWWYGFGRMTMRLLNDVPAQEISEVLTKTFRARLPEVVDQAQHFASLQSGAGTSRGDAGAAAFREGMDGTERERASSSWSRHLVYPDVDHRDVRQCSNWHRRARGRPRGGTRRASGVGDEYNGMDVTIPQ